MYLEMKLVASRSESISCGLISREGLYKGTDVSYRSCQNMTWTNRYLLGQRWRDPESLVPLISYVYERSVVGCLAGMSYKSIHRDTLLV